MNNKYVVYLRVSTQKQFNSQLGLEGQKATVQAFLRSQAGAEIIAEKIECESGKNDERPILAECIQLCKKTGATLLVSTLSRLTRSLGFLTRIEESGIQIRCADMPEMNNLILHILGSINHYELELVKNRTSAALQALKARGVTLGNPRIAEARIKAAEVNREGKVEFAKRMLPIIREIQAAGVSTLEGICKCLTARGIRTRNGGQWYAKTVANLLNAIPA